MQMTWNQVVSARAELFPQFVPQHTPSNPHQTLEFGLVYIISFSGPLFLSERPRYAGCSVGPRSLHSAEGTTWEQDSSPYHLPTALYKVTALQGSGQLPPVLLHFPGTLEGKIPWD